MHIWTHGAISAVKVKSGYGEGGSVGQDAGDGLEQYARPHCPQSRLTRGPLRPHPRWLDLQRFSGHLYRPGPACGK